MADTLSLKDLGGITSPDVRPQGARGNYVNPGTHLTEIQALRYFYSQDGSKTPSPVCVVELKNLKTVAAGGYNNLLTPDEIAAGANPAGTAPPHSPGERLSCSWKNKGEQQQIFEQAVKGVLVHAKGSLVNMIAAIRKLEAEGYEGYAEGTADATVKSFEESGLILSGPGMNELSGEEMLKMFSDAQPMAGIAIQAVSVRKETKTSKKRINATSFAPLTVEQWVKQLTEA